MIHCIGLNPSVDQIMEIPHFSAGNTYKVARQREFYVGKAISVALALHELGSPVKVVSLVGQDERKAYEEFLDSKGISALLFPVHGKTRKNISVIDPLEEKTTHIRFEGFEIKPKDVNIIEAYLESHIEEGDTAVFSGSLPRGCPQEFFFRPSEIIRRKKAHLVIDTSGPPLINMLLYHPTVIKANLEEMGTILGAPMLESNAQEFETPPTSEILYDLLDKCEELRNYNSKLNFLTLGKYGALAFDRTSAWHGTISIAKAAYNVGSGDAFLAGVLAQIALTSPMDEILRMGVACGAANTQVPGPGIFSHTHVKELHPRVSITRLQ